MFEFTTPVGRLVQGHPMIAMTKAQNGAPLLNRAGDPTQKYFAAVAFRKGDPAWLSLKEQLIDVARQAFPSITFGPNGESSRKDFALKISDGDGIDANGARNAEKPGFAGHDVLKFSTIFAPRCFFAGRYAPQDQIADDKLLPRGYYIRVRGSAQGNGEQMKPGIFVNMNLVEVAGVGDVIITGPDAAAVFGDSSAALPPGAAHLPGATPAAPAPAPNPAILAPPQMTSKAGGASYAQFVAQGWSDAQMRAEGYLL